MRVFRITTKKNYEARREDGVLLRYISDHDALLYFAETLKEATDLFKKENNIKRMTSRFTVEDITPSYDGGIRTLYGNDNMVYLIYRGEKVFSWYDGANCDYPEDLVWSRDLSEIFQKGIDLGKRIYKDEGK